MLDTTWSQALLIGGIFVLAGLVKGVLGMGLPTVAMGLLGLVLPVAQAASLLAVPSLATNVWQASTGPHLRALVRRLWTMQLGAVLGVASAAGWMAPAHAARAGALLGACLLAYALAGWRGWRLPRPRQAREPLAGAVVGFATGLVTAATGVFVLPAVPYLQALALDKDEMVQALGLSFTVSTVALAAVLASNGVLGGAMLGASTLALLPALLGMLAGQALRGRLSPATFRRLLNVFLGLLGAWLLLRHVPGLVGAD